jgi:hypothetical protein
MISLNSAPRLLEAAELVLNRFGKTRRAGRDEPHGGDDRLRGSRRYEDLELDLRERLALLISPGSQNQIFSRLYHGGWTHDYSSQSEADLACCSILAKRGFTKSEVDLIIRTSQLYREKWDRRDYRTRTLNLAFQNSGDGFESAEPWVLQVNQRYALVTVGSDVLIADSQAPSTLGDSTVQVQFLKVSTFKTRLADRRVDSGSSGKTMPLAEAWLRHPQRAAFDGVEFAPEGSTSPRLMNLWRGFAVQPIPGDISPWRETLELLVPNVQDQQYVLNWLGFKVQHPAAVAEVVLILRGEKGVGKNSLIEPILMCFGPHGMVADDAESVFGKFNGHLMDKAFVVLDEAVFAADPRIADRIKARVTGRSLTYEFKGLTPIQGLNRCAYVMLTNHDYVWRASQDERRAAVIEITNALQGNRSHWTKFYSWCQGRGPGALLHYLLNLDLGDFHPRRYKHTTAMADQVKQTLLRDPVIAWWYQVIEYGEVPASPYHLAPVPISDHGHTEIPTTTLQASYEHSAKFTRGHPPHWALAMRLVRQLCGKEIKTFRPASVGIGTRPRHYKLPPLQELRASFKAFTGVEVTGGASEADDVQADQVVQEE